MMFLHRVSFRSALIPTPPTHAPQLVVNSLVFVTPSPYFFLFLLPAFYDKLVVVCSLALLFLVVVVVLEFAPQILSNHFRLTNQPSLPLFFLF